MAGGVLAIAEELEQLPRAALLALATDTPRALVEQLVRCAAADLVRERVVRPAKSGSEALTTEWLGASLMSLVVCAREELGVWFSLCQLNGAEKHACSARTRRERAPERLRHCERAACQVRAREPAGFNGAAVRRRTPRALAELERWDPTLDARIDVLLYHPAKRWQISGSKTRTSWHSCCRCSWLRCRRSRACSRTRVRSFRPLLVLALIYLTLPASMSDT